MKVCCVEGCSGPDTSNPVFFEFPSSRLLRKRWLDAIKTPSVESGAVVCIVHFTRGDYDLVAGEARLRSRVVPSRRIGDGTDDEDSDSESSDSSESETDERTQDKNTNSKNNTKTHNENGSNDKVPNVNEDNKKVYNDNENGGNDNEKILNDNEEYIKTDIKTENSQTDNNTTETVKENSESRLNIQESPDEEKVQNDIEKIHNDNDNEKIQNDNEKVHNDNGEVDEDNRKVDNDNEKNNKNKVKSVRGRKTLCKMTARRLMNGRRKRKMSTDSSSSPDSVSNSPARCGPDMDGTKEDIEESLQHYYIENKKTERQVAAMTDVLLEEQEKRDEEARKELEREEQSEESTNPVFIELSVGQGSTAAGGQPAENDCLMLLESVQCDVDPTLLLEARAEEEENMEQVELDDDDDDEPVFVEKKKEDPISLLTSSDEDDVILQEPKIDTVEVSSADTSEDDMPLVKLVKPLTDKEKHMISTNKAKNIITQLLWGRNDSYCVQCRFTSSSYAEYTQHMATHSKVLQLCHDCGFASSSKHQMQKHKQKHKNEKRFHCQLCNYSAKHKMSLVYHMKTHNASTNEVELAICGTYEPSDGKSEKSRKSKKSKKSKMSEKSASTEKRYKCDSCEYSTDRKSDMKRHRRRIHDERDEDDEYKP